jgi:adenosylmethionine-8-amino-7-oxononanoate aminotransferase
MGKILSEKLTQALGSHPNVGDIRGRGLFWGIEFVSDKQSRTPFPIQDHVATEICYMGVKEPYLISVYPGAGTVDGVDGDHIILSPPYNTTEDEIQLIAGKVIKLVNDFFAMKKA